MGVSLRKGPGVLEWLHGVPGTGELRGWVLPGTWVGAVWGVVWGEVGRNRCDFFLCGRCGSHVRGGPVRIFCIVKTSTWRLGTKASSS